MEELLELKSITKIIQNESDMNNTILDHVDLTINKGDFITVLGGNGAGKSTLFNSITGSQSVTSGQIDFKEKNVTTWSEEKRARFMGRVFQDPKMGTAPRMTVEENLLLALKRGKKRPFLPRKLKEHRKYFEELCASIGNGLEDHLDTPTGHLSGGQRQSLSLLMTTLTEPDLLLLDEHTAALDPKTSKRLMALTNQMIQEKELTCLMITHRMEDALTYGNRLILMENGKVKLDLGEEEKNKLTLEDLFVLFERE
ncbi:MAG: ATP-binding cassette domain-containing protein [Alkalibacterium sp.]|uniref:Putative ABC transport system ATP-binding protein n=1 Tax=Alkalibacterium gilvum TaxID=1130080 RepID=A0A1H6S4F3_9LACT|nr:MULTISPECIES: ATP-binding cassette domain-containing protein [Alkalibacterium]MDN6194084.1 ATP-binding cassette domain-containing protein [Alkalibacterium sp.]MDN6294424.1 ATP-binding cassette domain-containing protein [Alkalibacterium sp.]MDN6296074.1 ATP-binding cassette domain-containing protein [Alkalibacterium sp.]MDN6326905.1 ATP-binding cassette domain-containing protein [Alkalibacterium sp.]MDN6385614.1 ATP-binding cassette domain-containing protein [Alkalibacterium sp.]